MCDSSGVWGKLKADFCIFRIKIFSYNLFNCIKDERERFFLVNVLYLQSDTYTDGMR